MRALLIAMFGLAGCMAADGAGGVQPAPQQRPPDSPALSYGGLNQNIRVGGLVVRPLAVTEDSRCPVNVVCVWAGRVVLRVRVSGLSGDQTISSIEPLALPGRGVLELVSVTPARRAGRPSAPARYRFGFRRRS